MLQGPQDIPQIIYTASNRFIFFCRQVPHLLDADIVFGFDHAIKLRTNSRQFFLIPLIRKNFTKDILTFEPLAKAFYLSQKLWPAKVVLFLPKPFLLKLLPRILT